MCNVEKYHKDILERYQREHHTWTKHILEIGRDELDFLGICKFDQSILITALYVNTDATVVHATYHEETGPHFYGGYCEPNSQYHHTIYWIESEPEPIASILSEAKRLPVSKRYIDSDICISELKRICIYEPFILLPYPFMFWVEENSKYQGCCIEYYIIDTPGLYFPYPDEQTCSDQTTPQGQFLQGTIPRAKLTNLDTHIFSKLGCVGHSRIVDGRFRFHWNQTLPDQEIPKDEPYQIEALNILDSNLNE